MDLLSRRRVLGLLGGGTAALGGGGYWFFRRGGDTDGDAECPDRLEPINRLNGDWSKPVTGGTDRQRGRNEDVLAFAGQDGGHRLAALDPRGREPEWIAGWNEAGGFGRPTPGDSRVFVSTDSGRLAAFRKDDGQRQWTFDAKVSTDGHLFPLVAVADGTVVAGVQRPGHDAFDGTTSLAGFGAVDGSIRWATTLDSEILSGPELARDIAVVVTTSGTVVGVDPETGVKRWRQTVEALTGSAGGSRLGSAPTPIFFADLVWIPTADDRLVGLDPETSRQATTLSPWDGRPDSGPHLSIETDLTTLVAGGPDGTVVAYGTDRSERWQYDAPARVVGLDLFNFDPTGSADAVGIVDARGVFTELDRATGEKERELLLLDSPYADRCGVSADQTRIGGIATTDASVIVSVWDVSPAASFGLLMYDLPY